MGPEIAGRSGAGRAGRRLFVFGLALVAALGLSGAAAQDATGTPAPEGTPAGGADGPQLVVIAPAGELDQGEAFEVEVRIEDVEHLAAFRFAIAFDPDRMEVVPLEGVATPTPGPTAVPSPTPPPTTPVPGAMTLPKDEYLTSLGEFLRNNGDRNQLLCDDPRLGDGKIVVGPCFSVGETTGAPVCVGGPAGASGSGILVKVMFRAKSGGEADLELVDTQLISDDVDPCPNGPPVEIEHSSVDTVVDIKGDSFPWIIVVAIVAVVIVLAGGGGFAYQRTRAR